MQESSESQSDVFGTAIFRAVVIGALGGGGLWGYIGTLGNIPWFKALWPFAGLLGAAAGFWLGVRLKAIRSIIAILLTSGWWNWW